MVHLSQLCKENLYLIVWKGILWVIAVFKYSKNFDTEKHRTVHKKEAFHKGFPAIKKLRNIYYTTTVLSK